MKLPWSELVLRSVLPALACAGLLAATFDANAKGGRRSGGSSSSKSSSHHEAPESSGSGATITIRTNSSSSGSSPSSGGGTGVPYQAFAPGRAAAVAPAAASTVPLTPDEEARRLVLLDAYEKEQQSKQAEQKAAAERQQAERVAVERAAEQRALQRAAEDRAIAARVAAEQERKRRDEQAVAADADRILQRAIADYPLLKTPEGQAVLQQILERQRALQGKGVYPSTAMVEAVADHSHLLAQKTKAVSLAPPPAAPAPEAPKAIGGCRWITPMQWGCN